jgi:serine/threonine protein phosphatase PrpC
MDFTIWASTDVGICKKTNQDSISLMVADAPKGKCCFAIVCDGMGGLADGEVASGTVIREFRRWFTESFPVILAEDGSMEDEVTTEWDVLCSRLNETIRANGAARGIRLGTTVTTLLLYDGKYIAMNIGDTRAYEITKDGIRQITEDQTFVNREIKAGRMTPEQAMVDERRNVLLQCVGASETVYPDMFFGPIQKDAVYMLCVDGFRHEISSEELAYYFSPLLLHTKEDMQRSCDYLINQNKVRREQDNITVGLVRIQEDAPNS